MSYVAQIFHEVKSGELPSSCQDVAWVSAAHESTGMPAFAVCDGATGGVDSQLWAQLVLDAVQRCIAELTLMDGAHWTQTVLRRELEVAQGHWQEQQALALQRIHADSGAGAAQMFRYKLQETGGATTLAVGLVRREAEGLRIRGVVVGDTSVFLHRPPKFGPIAGPTNLDDFGTEPALLTSAQDFSTPREFGEVPFDFRLERTDTMMICTDALAEWALKHVQAGAGEALSIVSNKGFRTLIRELNDADAIVLDDTLMVRLTPQELISV